MATPLRDLLTSLAFDDGARAACAHDPGQYLADHGWGDLDGADLATATTALTAELPARQAVALHDAVPTDSGATGPDYLSQFLTSLDPELDLEIDRTLDDADAGVGLDDPAERLDAPDHDPGLGVDRDHGSDDAHVDDGADGDLHLDFGIDVDLPTESATAADPGDAPAGATVDPADPADPFGAAGEATFDGWSDPADLDAAFEAESDLFADDPDADPTGFDPAPGPTDDLPDL